MRAVPAKALCLMTAIFGGSSTSASFLQPKNAAIPMAVVESENFTDVSEVSLANAMTSTFSTAVPLMSISSRKEQKLNAWRPMVFTELGSVMCFSLDSAKPAIPISSTPSGTV